MPQALGNDLMEINLLMLLVCAFPQPFCDSFLSGQKKLFLRPHSDPKWGFCHVAFHLSLSFNLHTMVLSFQPACLGVALFSLQLR